jgi:hypothetical protein
MPGSVEIVRGRRGVAATSPVHAVDATGRTVPVRAVLRDDRLVIDVPHRGRAVQYPVLVDPQVYEEDNDAWGWDYADDGSGVWTANGYPLGIGVYSQAPVGGRWAEETLTAPGTSSIVEFTASTSSMTM